jgi:anti-sigma regulatory factor (Ser/Thr protein kinase)
VGRSRAAVRAQAGRWGLAEETAETAVLLLSELVTNAVRHSRVRGRRIEVRCVLRDGLLRVEVSDAGTGAPVARTAGADDESGRGLALVAALAADWGVRPRRHGIGKTVWFECRR